MPSNVVAGFREKFKAWRKGLPDGAEADIVEFVKEVEAAVEELGQLGDKVLPESPYSWNTMVVDPETGCYEQFAVRAATYPVLCQRISDILSHQMIDHISRAEYERTPQPVVGATQLLQPAAGQEVAGYSHPTAATEAPTGGDNILTITGAMEASLYQGKWSWKVATNKSKYSVAVYEAVDDLQLRINHGGQPTAVTTTGPFVDSNGQPYRFDLTGRQAVFEKNEKGYPAKIIKFL